LPYVPLSLPKVMKKKKSLKRELIEWAVFLGVVAVLFFAGWYREVAGTIQRVILQTGVFKPEFHDAAGSAPEASYEFTLLDANGKLTPFSEFKGKPVFINLWATWCPPCIAEMPDIQKLYEDESTGDVAFVMISLDDEWEKAKKFVEKKRYSFPIYRLASPLPEVYNSRSIPATYVISRQGKIVMSRQGMADYYNRKTIAFLKGL